MPASVVDLYRAGHHALLRVTVRRPRGVLRPHRVYVMGRPPAWALLRHMAPIVLSDVQPAASPSGCNWNRCLATSPSARPARAPQRVHPSSACSDCRVEVTISPEVLALSRDRCMPENVSCGPSRLLNSAVRNAEIPRGEQPAERRLAGQGAARLSDPD